MSHTKGKVVLDRSIRTAINMASPPYQHIAMVNITQNKNYTITKEEHEDNARRLLALWNMAEELGLATEDIESGNVETKLKAAPDMLRTLESVLALINESFGVVSYHLLCGSFLHNGEVAKWEELGIREEVEAAIRKARGDLK